MVGKEDELGRIKKEGWGVLRIIAAPSIPIHTPRGTPVGGWGGLGDQAGAHRITGTWEGTRAWGREGLDGHHHSPWSLGG